MTTLIYDPKDFEPAENALGQYGKTLDDNFARVMEQADKLDAVIDRALAKIRADSIERVRAQAAQRAKRNGADPLSVARACDAAEAFLCAGLSHEAAVTAAAGEYRKVA